MAKSKYLSDKDIEKILRPKIDEIKKGMINVTKSAISAFYSDYQPDENVYTRTYSFHNLENLDMRYKEKKIENGIEMTFVYSSWDIGVASNIWKSSDPDWAFDADFVHGFHGGPRNIGNGVYSWSPVRKMSESPWDIILDYVESL